VHLAPERLTARCGAEAAGGGGGEMTQAPLLVPALDITTNTTTFNSFAFPAGDMRSS